MDTPDEASAAIPFSQNELAAIAYGEEIAPWVEKYKCLGDLIKAKFSAPDVFDELSLDGVPFDFFFHNGSSGPSFSFSKAGVGASRFPNFAELQLTPDHGLRVLNDGNGLHPPLQPIQPYAFNDPRTIPYSRQIRNWLDPLLDHLIAALSA